MTTSKTFVCAAVFGLATAACGNSFDPSSKIDGLRVLAVRADAPYARAGADVNLEALAVDSRGRATQILWIAGCANPPGDSYLACLPPLARRLEAVLGRQGDDRALDPARDVAPGLLAWGGSFVAHVPPDALTSAPGASRAGKPIASGRVLTFFAACAGELHYAKSTANGVGLPLRCADAASGADLDAKGFVFGFSTVFAFEALTNANPIVRGVSVDGVTASHLPCASNADCPPSERCGTAKQCVVRVAACAAGAKEDDCKHDVRVDVDRASAEIDPVASAAQGAEVRESVWIDAFTAAGEFKASSAVAHDARSGWSPDTKLSLSLAGTGAREIEVFGVVHDNRAGVSWVRDIVVAD